MNDFIALMDPLKDIIAEKITLLHSQYKTSSFHLKNKYKYNNKQTVNTSTYNINIIDNC